MAEAQLDTLLSVLDDRAAKLNAASDSLNSVLSKIESRLIDANIGLEVWLPAAIGSTDLSSMGLRDTTQVIDRLGFAKLGGTWCLATKKMEIIEGFFEDDTNCPYRTELASGDPTPLHQASRELRIASLQRMPELIQLLTSEAERCAQAVNSAGALVRK